MEIKRTKGIIKKIIDETPGVKSFLIELEDFSYMPGHFVMLSIDSCKDVNDYKEISRPFSISSSPTEKDIMLTIKLNPAGKLTPYLFKNMKLGDRVNIKGPYGRFVFDEREDYTQISLIAAGCGIAPMRSIAKYIKDKGIKTETNIFYTSRERKDIIYFKELENEFDEETFKIYLSLTKPDDEWTGLKGRIKKEFIKEKSSFHNKSVFFVCGSKEMVTDTKKSLMEIGAYQNQIKVEEW